MGTRKEFRNVIRSGITVLLVTLAHATWAVLPHLLPDIDKCAEKLSVCDQTCTCRRGNYVCSCSAGYRLNSDSRTCNDTDECEEKPPVCEQICNNTIGSYRCSCSSGYRLISENRTCVDVDECARNTSNCQQVCINNIGGYTCDCDTGYTRYPDRNGFNCTDVDECKANASSCSQRCNNTRGSYVCDCNSGYTLAHDKRSCDDIDECAIQLDNCTMLQNFICQNTLGGHHCVCKPGFQQVGPQECLDINECVTLASNCTLYDNMTCENTIGSYKCVPLQSNWKSTLIVVIVCVTVGTFLIVMAVVCFIICWKIRMRNKHEPTANNAELSLETAYDNAAIATNSKSSELKMANKSQEIEVVYEDIGLSNPHKESKESDATYESLDPSNRHKENFYEALEKQAKPYVHIYDNFKQTST